MSVRSGLTTRTYEAPDVVLDAIGAVLTEIQETAGLELLEFTVSELVSSLSARASRFSFSNPDEWQHEVLLIAVDAVAALAALGREGAGS